MSKSFWHRRLSISRKRCQRQRCQLSEVEGLGIIHVLELLPCESKAHTHTPHRMHIHGTAELFSQVSLLLFTVSATFRSFRTVPFGSGGICINLWPQSQYFLVMPTCCSPARSPPRTLRIVNGTFELSPDNGIIIFTLACGTVGRTGQWQQRRNTSAKLNLCRVEGETGDLLGSAFPWGYFAQRNVIIIVNYAPSRESRKLCVDFMKMN